MATVIDASVMAAQFLPDEEHSSLARVLLEQLGTEDRIVPRIFWYEIRHVLLSLQSDIAVAVHVAASRRPKENDLLRLSNFHNAANNVVQNRLFEHFLNPTFYRLQSR